MGCYDGAESCELVGSFILNKLTSIVNKSEIGLYRDDGLGIFYNVSKPEIERKKKAIVKIFKGCGLTITIQCHLKTEDFLDVTFGLDNNAYKKIIWFNPLFSKSVKSNIVRIFLRLYSKHFPRNHTMLKIFNRNTVKISYSCLRNISSIISSHNRNILRPKQKSFGCNCRVKNKCPLNSEC